METKFPLWHNIIVKIFAWCLWWFIHQNLWFSMHLQHFTYIFSFLLCLITCKTDISFGTLRSEVWGDKIVIGPTKEYYSLVPPNSLRKEQTRFGLPTICWHLCLILNNFIKIPASVLSITISYGQWIDLFYIACIYSGQTMRQVYSHWAKL